jgi:hypothetical protein
MVGQLHPRSRHNADLDYPFVNFLAPHCDSSTDDSGQRSIIAVNLASAKPPGFHPDEFRSGVPAPAGAAYARPAA